MALRSRPVLTDTFETLALFTPAPRSAYIFGTSFEERSAHSAEWERRAVDVKFVRITGQDDVEFEADVNGSTQTVTLRNGPQIVQFLRDLQEDRVYLDITGLDHHVWAPIVRNALAANIELLVSYVEPEKYRFSPTPRAGDIFDLSETIRGIAPLPGFASLNVLESDDVCFVPLLGFEGIRFKHVLEEAQPPRNRVFPIVGVPGFRAEYPFFTYDGNRPVLDETSAWVNIRFARANCPFSLYYALEDIASTFPAATLKISLIGTKPHALGAVLYYLIRANKVQIIYDHPKRKPYRTGGASRVLLYHISAFSRSS